MMLDAPSWGQLGLGAAAGAITVSLWLYSTGRLAGQEAEKISQKMSQVEQRMNDGGRRLSDLTAKITVLPPAISSISDEIVRLRQQSDTMNGHLSDMRVVVARLDERQKIQQEQAARKEMA